MQMKLFDSTIELPDDVAVTPKDSLDEITGVYRVALSDMWYNDSKVQDAIKYIHNQVVSRSNDGWLKKIAFELNGKKYTYSMVYVEVTNKYGFIFIEFEVALNGLKVENV